MLAGHVQTKDVNDGDSFSICVAPKTIVSQLPAGVGSSVTTIPLPPQTMSLFADGTLFIGMSAHIATFPTMAASDDLGLSIS